MYCLHPAMSNIEGETQAERGGQGCWRQRVVLQPPPLCLASAANPPLASPPLAGTCARSAIAWRFPSLSEHEAVGPGGLHSSIYACTHNPTSALRGGPAPLAVLPIPGGAVDGGLSMERVPAVAGVCYRCAKVEFIQQPARVLPIGNIRRRLTRDTCRCAEQGF